MKMALSKWAPLRYNFGHFLKFFGTAVFLRISESEGVFRTLPNIHDGAFCDNR